MKSATSERLSFLQVHTQGPGRKHRHLAAIFGLIEEVFPWPPWARLAILDAFPGRSGLFIIAKALGFGRVLASDIAERWGR